MAEYTLTHKGWFGLCPVYYADLRSEAPLVVERHWTLEPLLWISQAFYDAIGWVFDAAGSDYAMPYPLRVTGRIEPRTIAFEEQS
jgi:hypothetical protein